MKLTGKTYANVVDMTRDICGDDVADELGSHLANREVVNNLVVRRGVLGLTDPAIAEQLGWSIARLNRFESSPDARLRIGDVVDYAKAVGMVAKMVLKEEDRTP